MSAAFEPMILAETLAAAKRAGDQQALLQHVLQHTEGAPDFVPLPR